jgi:pre-mRNA-splicing factor ATP-dependent RNA helicase DHX15/PRP43
MAKAREKLPAFASRLEFLSKLHEHQGVVVTGETGCGKTTQIPQFILECNPDLKIVVCQPRRLAAVGVATRVAEEMDTRIGLFYLFMHRFLKSSS